MDRQDRSIQEIARMTGTTSRTLRHYDAIGLLPPSRTGPAGERRYDAEALVRLQRILLLRELGLGLATIGEVLRRETSSEEALRGHLSWLRQEQERLTRQIASVESTIEALRGGERIMAEDMFDGFGHTRYRDEVEQRWGADAYARGDQWWTGMSAAEREAWQQQTARLGADWTAAAASGIAPGSADAQSLAARHVAWLTGIPGTPSHRSSGSAPGELRRYVEGLGDLYVADERFAANYGGVRGADFVRDALRVYARASL